MHCFFLRINKLKNCIKFAGHRFQLFRRDFLNTATVLDSDFLDCFYSSDSEALDIVKKNFSLYQNFISIDEETELMKEIDPIFRRRRYEFNHWDGAIKGYKETEKSEWNEANFTIISRIRKFAFPKSSIPLKLVHVLDLAKSGHIKPHVDSIRFCGDIIAGLSLLSPSVFRLVNEQNKSIVDVFLPRRSLYVMKGVVRYHFTHEILDENTSYFKGKLIPRDRRVSVICRNEPVNQSAD